MARLYLGCISAASRLRAVAGGWLREALGRPRLAVAVGVLLLALALPPISRAAHSWVLVPFGPAPAPTGDPPKRSEYNLGIRGRREFHSKRAEWYERATGRRLEGSHAEQHRLFNDVTRRYRAYSDYRAQQPT